MAGARAPKTNGWSGHLTAVALAAFLTYINTLGNGFVLDDFGLILFNDAVRTFDAAFLLTSDYWAGYEGRISGLYRPLTTLSLALEFHLWGERPELFHLTNTLLHAANALLVYSLGRHLGKAAIGLGAGLLFATHPLHSEAVAYVAGRADLLASLFALAALNCSLRARQTGKTRWRALAVLALAPGLLCKEQAAIVPGLLLGMDWLLWRQGRLKRWPWAEYGAHILVLSVYLCARYAALGGLTIASIDFLDNPLAGMPAHLRTINAGGVLLRYLALLLFPHRLSADYSFNAIPLQNEFLSLALIRTLLMLAAVLFLLYHFYQRPGLWSFGALWLLVGLSPVSNLVLPIGTIMAERLLYLPSVGFALLSAVLLQKAWRAEHRRICAIACSGLLLIYAGRAWVRNFDWEDNERLFRAVAEISPQSARVHQGLGSALNEKGDWLGAIEEYRRAIEIYPQYQMAHYSLGLAYWSAHRHERALEAFQEAVRLKPRDAKSHLNLGATYHALGRLSAAVDSYQSTIALSPAYAPAWQNLADTYYEMGNRKKASLAYQKLLHLQPDHPRRKDFAERIRKE